MRPGLWLNRGLWREALKYDSGARKYLHTDAFTQNFFHESKGFPFIWKEFKLPPFDHLQIFKLIYGHSHLLLPLCSSLPPSKAIFTRTGVPSPPDFSRLPPRLSLSVLCCSILSYLSWFSICSIHYWDAAFRVAQMVKNPPANAGHSGSIPESGRSPGEGHGNPLQYSCLEDSMDRGAWRDTVRRVRVGHNWSDLAHT